MTDENYDAATVAQDVPRIVRKDMTMLSELAAKYRGLGVAGVLPAVFALRTALAEVYAGDLTEIAYGGNTPEPAPSVKTLDYGGRPPMLSAVLALGGFVSSSAVAIRAIAAKQVELDGAIQEKDKPVELGEHAIRCGETAETVLVK